MTDALPERVWLFGVDTYRGWAPSPLDDEGVGPYVPESRALAAEAEVVALKVRVQSAEESEAAKDQKLDVLLESITPDGLTCGCSYDRPDGICLHHSPQIVALRAEVAQLRADIKALVPFAKQGLDLAANCYAPHIAARAVLDRIGTNGR